MSKSKNCLLCKFCDLSNRKCKLNVFLVNKNMCCEEYKNGND